MDVILSNIGRRFNREWIFEGIDHTFESGQSYAILGHNGSGKSTLLQVIAGSLTPSSGTIAYMQGDTPVDIESVYQNVSIAAPYLELIEEFSLTELLDFHFRFKRPLDQLTTKQIISLLGLERSSSKPLKYFSSGMKQRTKLALALCSDTSLVLLDEPASNLDMAGTAWYKDIVGQFGKGRTLIVCSNQDFEYDFCDHQLKITDYKKTQ
ncbi:ABC transporter family protein [Arcticibacter pallidicorallinus]|uniref:ABC transporter family protein n=1 Tax=Arcticibacter pallidicorallinus TaxID=1259464 RepID=A0A2T0U7M7_9SPHI|nr:ATP-binding cassette domain-containing protein [Arcticibacter pallidicorallinus]PRY53909.1 ABC transporter family protein [Arcticibacter pallidicorallinus]